jgi:uncharacterized protein with WD repeat
MPFEDKNRISKGRPKGAINKTTSELREIFSLLLENNFDKLQTDIDLLEPKDRIKVILELAKFVVPTLKMTELSKGNENGFNPVVINLGKGINPEEIRKINAELEAKY